jgi:hypothetical protein
MDCNEKIAELEASTEKINLLIEQLKDEIVVQQNRNKQLKKLKEIIYDYSHENSEHFTASYNVGRLKAIIHHMFGIIEQQDKRISELERK